MSSKIISIISLVFLSIQGISQDIYKYSDSEKELVKLSEDLINDIYDNKITNANELNPFIKSANKVDTPFARGLEKRVLGVFYKNNSESVSAQENFSESVKILGSCCTYSKEYAHALAGYSGVLSNAGLMNFDTILFQKAKEITHKSATIAEIVKDTSQWIRSVDFLGDFNYYSAYRINNYDSAIHYYKIVEQLNLDYDNAYHKANNALGFANVYRELNNPEKEKIYFELTKEIAVSENYNSILYALYFDKGGYFDDKEDFKTALKYKLIGYDYVIKSGDKEFINRADRQLWWTYKKMGKYKDALYHYERYQKSIAEMKKSEALQLESELKYKEEILEKEKEITLLENENLKSNRNNLLLIAGLIGGLLLLSLWTNRRLKRNNNELENKNREILLAQVTGQNIERKRMAGELHDNLNTKIAAIRWQLEAIQVTESLNNPELLDHTIDQLNGAYEDIRLISHNLMPETVQSIGLLKSIEDLIDNLNKNDKVKFHFITDELKDVKFDSLAYPVYNIIFEMVNNIMKHAQATNAWISLSRNDKKDLKISVSDDGKGFDVDEMKGGYGIKNITSRVGNLHGDYKIESAPGKGTKIYIEIPHL